jgi:hypothetical protein
MTERATAATDNLNAMVGRVNQIPAIFGAATMWAGLLAGAVTGIVAGFRELTKNKALEAVAENAEPVKRTAIPAQILEYVGRKLAEDESFEENPLNLLDFVQRDLRWCAGNMQYLHFLTLPGLKTTSRVQLILAILMFLAGPAWLLGTVAMVALVSTTPTVSAVLDISYLWAALGSLWVLTLAPKLVSVVAVLLQVAQRRAFGGASRFAFGVLLEIFFSMVISPD